MRIFIITMDDPLYTLPFINEIIEVYDTSIVGVAVSKGDRLTVGKKRSKAAYVLSLFLIMGPLVFMRHSAITLWFKLRKWAARRTDLVQSPSILTYAAAKGIRTFEIGSPNEPAFVDSLRELRPDVIINQSQSIIKKEVLDIPVHGVLNRHNAILPRNRGRLTPFWVLYKDEAETGVSIHFLDENIDAGAILVQERFSVDAADDFDSLVRKNYKIAPKAMLRALAMIESGNIKTIPNPDDCATYNTVPSCGQAARFRWKRIKRALK